MAQSNLERVGRALELLNKRLRPFVEREMLARYGTRWQYEALKSLREQHFRMMTPITSLSSEVNICIVPW